ncbi:MAG: hypothetical protein E7644_03280 [Ruminococcaceae bacterium]|nr:hypothetical protein [Oscillospiraceae bacterium]
MKKNRRHRNFGLQGLALLLSIVLLFVFMPISAVALCADLSSTDENAYWSEIHPPHDNAHNVVYRSSEQWEQVYACLSEKPMFFGKFRNHQSLSAFGELQEMRLECTCDDNLHSNEYWVSICGIRFVTKDENDIYFSIELDFISVATDLKEEANASLIQDMRSVKGTAYEDKDALTIGDLAFHYKSGELFRIAFEYEGTEYEVASENLSKYPHAGSNTLTMRLLNVNTAKEAFEELCAQLHVEEEPANGKLTEFALWLKQPPVLVGIGAISGAVIAALITYLILRKRRGGRALTAAAATAPADASADTSTDTPTAPAAENPPAPEDPPTPPEL